MLFVGCFALFSRDAMPGEDPQGAGAAGERHATEVRAVLIVFCVLVVGILSLCLQYRIENNTVPNSKHSISYGMLLLACCCECIPDAF